ncbi:MAG: hypothetical protein RIQ54_244 [Candidatus Parcubacteria bacterium]|jgi:hypothetical protein
MATIKQFITGMVFAFLLLSSSSFVQAQVADVSSGASRDSSGVIFTTNLTVGSRGAQVSSLQKFLAAQGFIDASFVTGYFGSLTRNALARFQAANGITPASGYFGPLTRAQIARLKQTITTGSGDTVTGPAIVSPSTADVVVSPLGVVGVAGKDWACVDGVLGVARMVIDGITVAESPARALKGCNDSSAYKPFAAQLVFVVGNATAGTVQVVPSTVGAPSLSVGVRFPSSSQQVMSFIAPVGGERYISGKTYTIRWTGGLSKVSLSLYKRSLQGGSDVAVWSYNDFDNIGSYEFTVPENLEGLFRFSITDKSGISVNSNSFGIINGSVVPPSTTAVSVTAPAPGDSWLIRSSHMITWDGAISTERVFDPCADKVVSVVDVSTGKRFLIGALTEKNIESRSLPWIVGDVQNSLCSDQPSISTLSPGTYQIEITWWQKNSGELNRFTAKSDPFTIAPAVSKVTVVSPAGGETWLVGQEQKISWTVPPLPISPSTVTISVAPQAPACLLANPPCKIAVIAPYIITENAPNTGVYTWKIPTTIPDVFLGTVRVTVAINGSDILATSNPFILKKSSEITDVITVLTPAAGDQWQVGSANKILWSAPQKISKVDIYAQSHIVCITAPCNSPSVRPIAFGVPNTGSYSWSIPSTFATGSYVLRISDSAAPSMFGVSGAFSVVPAVLPPPVSNTILLTAPQDAQQISIGSTQTIRWIAPVAVKFVSIAIRSWSDSCAGIAICSVRPAFYKVLATRIANTGSYEWLVSSDIPVGSYSIVITDADVPSTGTASAKPFSIISSDASTPGITVTAPNSGGTFQIGSSLHISWSTLRAPAGSWVALFLNSVAGSSKLIQQQLSPQQGSYQWTIPVLSGDTSLYTIEARLYTGPSLCTGEICAAVVGPALLAQDTSDVPIRIESQKVPVQLGDSFQLVPGGVASVQNAGMVLATVAFDKIVCSDGSLTCASPDPFFTIQVGDKTTSVKITPNGYFDFYGFRFSLKLLSGTTATMVVTYTPTTVIRVSSNPAVLAGVVAQAFSSVISAAGGTAPYVFRVSSGVLPAGLSLSPVVPACGSAATSACTGTVSALLAGTPTQQGAYSFVVSATDTKGFVGSQNFSIVVDPAPVSGGGSPPPVGSALSCNQSLLIPSYFYPSNLWNTARSYKTANEIMIMNPASGPGASKDLNYEREIANTQAAGISVIGYVHTSYGTRITAAKADIDKYKSFYPAIKGIFIDEVPTAADKVAVYQDLYNYIQTKFPNAIVVMNPGTIPDERYMSIGNSILMIFEGTFSTYNSWSSPAWAKNYPASRISHLVYGTATEADMKTASQLAFRRNAGYLYVTSDVLPNPWDSLPSYFAAEVAQMTGSTCSLAQGQQSQSVAGTANLLDSLVILLRQMQGLF